METRSTSALHPVHRWRRTRGADTISSFSDQIFEFSQRLNRFSAPLLPNTQVTWWTSFISRRSAVDLNHLSSLRWQDPEGKKKSDKR
jgi:hypothetical protein